MLAQLERRLATERLIAAIATRFVSVTGADLDAAIDEAVGRLGAFSDVDRSYVLQFTPDLAFASNTHEWCAEGIEPQIGNLQGVPLADFEWFLAQLRSCAPIYVSSVTELPADAVAERATLAAQGIQSIVCVPMMAGGALRGMLGFDSVRAEKVWRTEDIGLLQIVAQLIAASLERERVIANERSLARLEGVLLAARTAQHELNNQLAIVLGYAETVSEDPGLPGRLRPIVAEILQGAESAATIVDRLRRITNLIEVDRGAPGGSILDLDTSTRPIDVTG
ncbi:MAG: GAF domain-containing protein [Chloroflexota bacterium]